MKSCRKSEFLGHLVQLKRRHFTGYTYILGQENKQQWGRLTFHSGEISKVDLGGLKSLPGLTLCLLEDLYRNPFLFIEELGNGKKEGKLAPGILNALREVEKNELLELEHVQGLTPPMGTKLQVTLNPRHGLDPYYKNILKIVEEKETVGEILHQVNPFWYPMVKGLIQLKKRNWISAL